MSGAGRFFITGLPRSRTAWFAAVCDAIPGVTCYHEPLREFSRWDDVGAIWDPPVRSTGERFIGVSDSSLGLHLGEILAQFRPQTLIVRRPFDDVIASLVEAGFPVSPSILSILQRRLDRFQDNGLVKTVDFKDLDRIDIVYDALQHIVPGAIVDRDKLSRLMGMIITATPELAAAAARRRAPDLSALLGADVVAEIEAAAPGGYLDY